tara:strand:- start:2706 stop:3152 length:447 start_codon:yes stop_codon:yes gene_type:complete
MINRTIDPTAVRRAFMLPANRDPSEAHEERRAMLHAGLWLGAGPNAKTARTAAELGACIATLILSENREDILPGIVSNDTGLTKIAAALSEVTQSDDAGVAEWWWHLVDATEQHLIDHPSLEAMGSGTIIGMRSVIMTLATRLTVAAQ